MPLHETNDRRTDAADASLLSREDLEAEVVRLRGRPTEPSPERRRRAILDSTTSFAIVVTDRDGLVTDWNVGAERILGWSSAEMCGRDLNRIFTPEDRASDRIGTEMRLSLEKGRADDERWHLRKDGTRFWASGEMMPLRGDGDLAIGFVKVLRDRTAEHMAGKALEASEARLRESEDHYRHTVELNPQVPWTCDPAGNITSYSNRWLELTGQAPGEPLGAGWAKALHPDDVPHTMEAFARSLGAGEPVDVDYRIFDAVAGEHRWMRARAYPRRDEAGAIVRWYGVVEDIHDRKLAETALRDSEEQFRAFAQAVPNHVWAATPDGDLYWFNERSCAYAGEEGGSLAGTGWMHLVHPDDLPQAAQAWGRALASGTVYGTEFRVRRADGAYRWFLVRAEPVRGSDGAILRWVGTNTDIHERREQAEELAHLNGSLEEQVVRRTRDLMAAEDALRQSQKLEAVGQLTGGVAHDFNNLLTIIRSSIDFLRRPNLAEERRTRYIEAVSDTVDRATKLTGQLLAFARRQALRPEVFDVGERLRGVADMLDTVTGARIRVVAEVPPGACHVRADLSQFETALVNMAVNARDAMDGEGRLTLRLDCCASIPPIRGHAAGPGRFAAVSLTDTGAGIPADLLPKIFEPFFTTKEVGKGTGLGLSQVFGFAKQSGGDVDVRSEPGRGTTFTLYLPEVDAEARLARESGPEGPGPGGSGQRVLVVEDNVEVGRFATQILQDLGYETQWAVNAEEALERLGADGGGFDAVFSDVVMPGMGGIALARDLRERMPGLPVVLASGYSQALAEDGGHGFELLNKPYSADQLSRVLSRVSRRGVAARG